MFRALGDIASDVAGQVTATKLFGAKSVSMAQVSSYEQLIKHVVSVGPLPAAVVCIGAGATEHGGLQRKMTVAAIVLAAPGGSETANAASIWALVDAVQNLFAPVVDAEGNATPVGMNDVSYTLAGWTPLDDERLKVPAVAVEFETNELF